MMKTALTSVLLCAAWLSGPAAAADALSPRADNLAAQERIDAEYRAARERCQTVPDDARDVCYAEAKARQRIDQAAAAARVDNAPRARYAAQIARAEAEYQVAKERCKSNAGKDPCVHAAEEAEDRAKAQAAEELQAAEGVANR